LKYLHAFQRDRVQLPHVLIVIRRVGSDVGCSGHDRGVSCFGQHVSIDEVCIEVLGEVVPIILGDAAGTRFLPCAQRKQGCEISSMVA
jgi:hypothetical protein